MGVEDGPECSNINIAGVPCKIDDNRDGKATICPFDGCGRNGGCPVQNTLEAIVHAVPIHVWAVAHPPAVGFRSIAFSAVRPAVRSRTEFVTAHQGRDAVHHVDAWFGFGQQGLAARCGRSCDHQNEKKEGNARAACTLVRASAHQGTVHQDTFEPIPLPLHQDASSGGQSRCCGSVAH